MTEQNFESMRHAMVVSQLRTTGVSDARVVDAMGKVAREAFVPADKAALAYLDITLPLGSGRALNAPMVTGRLLVAAELVAGERVLLIGAATGYTAALLSVLGTQVVAVEENAALSAVARDAGVIAGVQWIDAALTAGAPSGAPYDVLLIDGAVETVPDALVAQLRDGGRLVGAIVEQGITRLFSGRKAGNGFGLQAFADVDAAILPGFASPPVFEF